MSETTNYGLYITDSSSEKFIDWRTKMNGVNDSNMVKIDNVLAQKADESRYINMTLLASGWSGNAAPYTQVLSIDGLTATENGSIALSQSATLEQRVAAKNAALFILEQRENELVIATDGNMPGVDIPVCIVLLG